MASHDQKPDGGNLQRSLSEQLRVLEEHLGRLNGDASVQLSHPSRDPMGQPNARHPYAGLPTSLGRPIGLAPLPRAPVLGVPEHRPGDEDFDAPASPRPSAFRRHAVVGGCSLLLLTATAIVPPLLHRTAPPPPQDISSDIQPAAPVELRTEQFAQSARELGQIDLPTPASADRDTAAPAPIITPPAAAPEIPSVTRESRAPEGPPSVQGQTTKLTVVESNLQRLGLPLLVSGGGPSWAGSAVVIDGLPAEARVSHGLRIAPDTWTVGIDDVGHAVLSLPPTTPDRLELSVRVLAANSHELASSALEINVVRGQSTRASAAPAAIFEPAAANTDSGPTIEPPLPISRQAVKVDRMRRIVPPQKPPVTQQSAPLMAAQPDRPKEISSWVSTIMPPAAPTAPAQSWSPFKD